MSLWHFWIISWSLCLHMFKKKHPKESSFLRWNTSQMLWSCRIFCNIKKKVIDYWQETYDNFSSTTETTIAQFPILFNSIFAFHFLYFHIFYAFQLFVWLKDTSAWWGKDNMQELLIISDFISLPSGYQEHSQLTQSALSLMTCFRTEPAVKLHERCIWTRIY